MDTRIYIEISTKGMNIVVSRGLTAFSIFVCGGRKEV